MGALTRTELLVELLTQTTRLAVALGPQGVLVALGCFLLVRALRDDAGRGTGLLCATSILVVLALVGAH